MNQSQTVYEQSLPLWQLSAQPQSNEAPALSQADNCPAVIVSAYRLVAQIYSEYANLLDEYHSFEHSPVSKNNNKRRVLVTLDQCKHFNCRHHREKLTELDRQLKEMSPLMR